MMYFAERSDITILAIKQMNKPAVFVGNHLEFDDPDHDAIMDEIREAVALYVIGQPQYSDKKFFSVLEGISIGGLFFFDSDDLARKFFEIFNTGLVYSSPVYATLHASNGECITENT